MGGTRDDGTLGFEEVFAGELEEVRQRWGEGTARSAPSDTPSTRNGLVGLAFSGGGIRTATLNLGVMRRLAHWGVLPHVDYLSTVSGGGYVGSMISHLMAQRRLDLVLGDRAPGIDWLRQNSRYLTPDDRRDWARIVGLGLRGMVLNFTLVAPVAVIAGAVVSLGLTRHGTWTLPWMNQVPLVAVVAVLGLLWTWTSAALRPGGGFDARDRRERSFGTLVIASGAALLLDLQPTLFAATRGLGAEAAGLSGSASLVLTALSGRTLEKLPAALQGTLAQLVAALVGLVFPATVYLVTLHALVGAGLPTLGVALGVAAAVLAYGLLLVDVNQSSVHPFYRDRLSTAYLFEEGPDGIRPTRSVPMSGLSPAGSGAPYHLVNVSLNLQGEGEARFRDRNADFFVFSKRAFGGPRVGFAPTTALERAVPDFHLGSAFAISGAAAAPNMGAYTSSSLTFVMALLNVRMGAWVPSPRAVIEGRGRFWPDVRFLFREMIGAVDTRGRLLNLSDGGHLENTGAYELLRRRCRLVIVGDGEADGTMSCGGFADLLRHARTDLGVHVDIDLDDLRVDAKGYSRKRAALGVIHYPDGERGFLLYLKSAVTGHEPVTIANYRDMNPDFPHETTADQFFDDRQFDAYLELGEATVDELFRGLGRVPGDLSYDALLRLLAVDLRVALTPTSRSRDAVLTEALADIQRMLLRPEYAAYRSQLVPTEHRREVSAADRHGLVPVVTLQLQLMEDALLRLDLADPEYRDRLANRGWINLFQRWAESEAFQRVALVCLPSFSAGLAAFCAGTLGLGVRSTWFRHPSDPKRLVLGNTSSAVGEQVLVGVARVAEDGGRLRVERLALRPGFGGVDRLQDAVAALRSFAEREGRTLELPSGGGDIADDLSYELDLGQRPWGPDDEAALRSAPEADAPGDLEVLSFFEQRDE